MLRLHHVNQIRPLQYIIMQEVYSTDFTCNENIDNLVTVRFTVIERWETRRHKSQWIKLCIHILTHSGPQTGSGGLGCNFAFNINPALGTDHLLALSPGPGPELELGGDGQGLLDGKEGEEVVGLSDVAGVPAEGGRVPRQSVYQDTTRHTAGPAHSIQDKFSDTLLVLHTVCMINF